MFPDHLRPQYAIDMKSPMIVCQKRNRDREKGAGVRLHAARPQSTLWFPTTHPCPSSIQAAMSTLHPPRQKEILRERQVPETMTEIQCLCWSHGASSKQREEWRDETKQWGCVVQRGRQCFCSYDSVRTSEVHIPAQWLCQSVQ